MVHPLPEKKEGEYIRSRLPNKRKGEMFGIADQLLGASHIRAASADGVSRLARIPGKLRKRMWIREGDLVIVKPWDFQPAKADTRSALILHDATPARS